jgi:hypothetical protein
MADVVKVEEDLLSEGGRHQRAENAGRNVPEDLNTFNYLGDHAEARQQFHGGNIWTSQLRSCNERKIHRLRSGDGGLGLDRGG